MTGRLAKPLIVNPWEEDAQLWVIRQDGSRTGLYDAFFAV